MSYLLLRNRLLKTTWKVWLHGLVCMPMSVKERGLLDVMFYEMAGSSEARLVLFLFQRQLLVQAYC
jgi:hypothetical protein